MSNYSNVQQTDYVPQLNLASGVATYFDCGMPIKLTGLILYFTQDVAGSPVLYINRRKRPSSSSAAHSTAIGTIDFTGKPLPEAGDTVHFDFNNIDETGTVGNRGDRFVLSVGVAGTSGNCIVGWKGYPFENTRNVHVYGEVPRGKTSPDGRVVDGAKFVEAT